MLRGTSSLILCADNVSRRQALSLFNIASAVAEIKALGSRISLSSLALGQHDKTALKFDFLPIHRITPDFVHFTSQNVNRPHVKLTINFQHSTLASIFLFDL